MHAECEILCLLDGIVFLLHVGLIDHDEPWYDQYHPDISHQSNPYVAAIDPSEQCIHEYSSDVRYRRTLYSELTKSLFATRAKVSCLTENWARNSGYAELAIDNSRCGVQCEGGLWLAMKRVISVRPRRDTRKSFSLADLQLALRSEPGVHRCEVLFHVAGLTVQRQDPYRLAAASASAGSGESIRRHSSTLCLLCEIE
jgi:hypothetical protein